MKIRSITCYTNPVLHPDSPARLGEFAREAARRFTQSDYAVQTSRLATTPFTHMLPDRGVDVIRFAQKLEAESNAHGFGYLSLGCATPDDLRRYAMIPDILAATQNVFVTASMGSAGQGVSLPAVRACGEIIHRAATITPDGFTNLRFAALANVAAHVPFFPAAYHAGDAPAFALAIECADVAVNAFSSAASLAEGRQRLLDTLNQHGAVLGSIAAGLEEEYQLHFKGIDFSLAPFPEDCCSLAGAMERIGVPAVGLLGTLSTAAILADTLDQGSWLRTGFNGMMLPVLEDSIMAHRTGGVLSVKDLLMISSVCGAGLDTVPLPGDAAPEQLAALLLDLATLALRLGKPLTARLMPVPGKQAGDMTSFDFGFFANGRVMALPAAALQGVLTTDEIIQLSPRRLRL